MNIVVTTYPFNESNKHLEKLKNLGYDVYFNPAKRKMTPMELEKFLSFYDPEVIIAGTEKYDSKILDLCHNLKMISRVGIGMDSVDLAECKKRKIKVTNTPDAPSNAVSDLTICQMLNALRFVQETNDDMVFGKWSRKVGRDIKNCKIGIIGCGRIGKLVIGKLKGFGVKKILINDINKKREQIPGCAPASKKEILKESDIISIHIPLNSQNFNYICQKELSLIKKNAVIINTSRSGIVNEKDLYDWLLLNKEVTAVIDVFEQEPYHGDLLKLTNALLTPHLGSCSIESRTKMENGSILNVIKYLKND